MPGIAQKGLLSEIEIRLLHEMPDCYETLTAANR
jgi:hypothetical protein